MSKHASRIKKLETRRTSNATSETTIPRDPVAFARLLDIEPDQWQRDLLASTDERVILNCCRQSGKTTIVSVLALHHALIHPKSLVLIFSPSERQSKEFLKKIQDYYSELGSPGSSLTNSASTLELTNRSRIVALPSSEATVRGFSAPSLVLVDEAAQIDEELYYAVLPMLVVSCGRLILLSTPLGKRGIFWSAWEQQDGWKKLKVTGDQCPRISDDSLAQAREEMGELRFAQEYLCEFVQSEGSIFKEEWVQYFHPADRPDMDTIIQSWDTAQTKSTSSDFVVGQVWGRRDADFYLLDQVRGRWDFDETVDAMKQVTKTWSESSAIIVEAQSLGAALASHLKRQISGIIPIHVKQSKELRAMNCIPAWQSKNVFIPHPDKRQWVREYVSELTNFPNAAHDDQVDATTLALNQLRGALFPNMRTAAKPIKEKPVQSEHEYFIGWIPARLNDEYTVLVYDLEDNEVVKFFRTPAQPIEQQVRTIYQTSVMYNSAACRVIEGYDDALTYSAELKGTYVQKIKFNAAKFAAAYENLSQLISNFLVDIPEYPELMAELSVFKSAFTYDEKPDYSLQIAQQSGIHALCLVTYDLDPTMWGWGPDIYANFDFDIV
jgi:predicted phage terminase large subunit-like protein